jgi:hypothetical protein
MIWDLYRDGVTCSFMTKFLTCKEQCRLHYAEGWRSIKSSKPIEFGNCIHWCLAEIFSNGFDGAQIPKVIKKYDKYWNTKVPNPTQFQLDQQNEVYKLSLPVLLGYFKKWPAEDKKDWEMVEEVFDVEMLGIRLRGRIDGAIKKGKGLYLFETKTKSRIDEETIVRMLPVDLQVMTYMTAIRKITGRTPKGVIYNLIRRPGLYQRKTESENEYYKRVHADVMSRIGHYYMQFIMRITAKELNHFEKHVLGPIIDNIKKWEDGGRQSYVNPVALLGQYGKCDLFDPLVDGNFSGHFQVDTPFTELVED